MGDRERGTKPKRAKNKNQRRCFIKTRSGRCRTTSERVRYDSRVSITDPIRSPPPPGRRLHRIRVDATHLFRTGIWEELNTKWVDLKFRVGEKVGALHQSPS